MLTDLPGDFRFVLALHEGSVVGMATGWAIGRGEPALAILHTTAGLGNAVGALATARVNRAPLVVVVGQQDRRHLATEPFLAGRLHGLAGEYPVWVDQPVRPQDVPGAIARALPRGGHRQRAGARDRADGRLARPRRASAAERAAPRRVLRARGGRQRRSSRSSPSSSPAPSAPALVVGAGADDPETWRALVALAERLGCPVWQESVQRARRVPAGSPALRRPPPGRPRPPARAARAARRRARGRRAGVPAVPVHPGPVRRSRDASSRWSASDPAEVHRSTADLAVLAAAGPRLRRARARRPRARRRAARRSARLPRRRPRRPRASRCAPATSSRRIAERLPRNAIVIEESPSSRPELLVRLPAREPLGSLSPAMGGLGFALPAATGLRMARPDRPVVAIVGDGSSLYSIQALWSAAHYGAGALFVILANGGYAIMDRLAEQAGGSAPWPGFAVDVAGLARALGLPGAHASASTTSSWTSSTRCCPASPAAARAAAPGGRRRPGRDVRAVTHALPRGAPGRERAGRLRDPPLPLGARPAPGRAPRHRAGARGRVRCQPTHAARGPPAARELAPDPRAQGPGGGIFVASTQNEGMRRNVSESIAVMLETDRRLAVRARRCAHLARGAARRPRRAARDRRRGGRPAGGDRRGRGQPSRLRGVPGRGHALPSRDRERGSQRAPAGVHELDARRAAAVADRHDRRLDRRRGDPRPAPRDPARHPPAPAGRRPARDAPAPRLPEPARPLARHPDAEGEP